MKGITLASTALWGADEVTDPPLLLIEIVAANFPGSPIRIVPDNLPLTHNNEIYKSFALEIKLPNDGTDGEPRMTLSIGNAPSVLLPYVMSGALDDATITLRIVRRSTPNTIDWETTMYADFVTADENTMTFELSHKAKMNLRAMRVSYTPDIAPGLYH